MRKHPRGERSAAARPLPRIVSLVAAALPLTALFAPATARAFDVRAKLERDGIGPSGPSESACTFCPNTSTRVSTSFSGGFPPPLAPVALPANSEISGMSFVDLATGVMRGRSHAVSYGDHEEHQMRFASSFKETIDLDVPAGLPAADRFVIFLADVHVNANATNRASGKALYVLQAGDVRVTASLSNDTGWDVLSGENDPRVQITPLANGFRFRLKVMIPNSTMLIIESVLEGTAWAEARLTTGVGIADVLAGNTATLSMTLPEGVTYTSTSGVFLTVPPGPEIGIDVTGGNVVINYSGILESSPTLAPDSWTPVLGATSPYQFPRPASGLLFYRAASP